MCFLKVFPLILWNSAVFIYQYCGLRGSGPELRSIEPKTLPRGKSLIWKTPSKRLAADLFLRFSYGGCKHLFRIWYIYIFVRVFVVLTKRHQKPVFYLFALLGEAIWIMIQTEKEDVFWNQASTTVTGPHSMVKEIHPSKPYKWTQQQGIPRNLHPYCI